MPLPRFDNTPDPLDVLKAEYERKNRTCAERWNEFDRERKAIDALGIDVSKDEGAFSRLTSLHDEYKAAAAEFTAVKDRQLELLEQRARHGGLLEQVGGRSLGHVFADGLKAMLTESGSGQYLVPFETLPRVWDRLRERTVALASGFTVIPTDSSELRVPRLTASAVANWTAEATPITESEPTVDEVIVKPSKLAALVSMSNELRLDSPPELLQIVFDDLIAKLGAVLDKGFYEGTGVAPQILGIKNVAGIQTVSMGVNGAAPTNLDPFADAIGLLETENSTAGAIVMHPRTWQTLSKLKEQTSGNNKPLLQESAGSGGQPIARSIYGVPVFLSSQLSITETQGTASNASSAYVYAPEQVVAVRREELRLELDGSEKFSSDVSLVRAILRFGLAVPNAKAVGRILGLLP